MKKPHEDFPRRARWNASRPITRSDDSTLIRSDHASLSRRDLIRSPRSGVDEAVVLAVAEDHVVEDADAEEFAGVAQALRELDVLCARCRIPARMIVSQEDRRGVAGDGRLEDFARVKRSTP